jgi:hypothetical protein
MPLHSRLSVLVSSHQPPSAFLGIHCEPRRPLMPPREHSQLGSACESPSFPPLFILHMPERTRVQRLPSCESSGYGSHVRPTSFGLVTQLAQGGRDAFRIAPVRPDDIIEFYNHDLARALLKLETSPPPASHPGRHALPNRYRQGGFLGAGIRALETRCGRSRRSGDHRSFVRFPLPA